MTSNISVGVLCAIFISAHAVVAHYVDSEGRKYIAKTAAQGVILESRNLTMQLWRNCSASSRQYGKGTWAWANGGFSVIFAGTSVRFPRQEIDLDNNGACREE